MPSSRRQLIALPGACVTTGVGIVIGIIMLAQLAGGIVTLVLAVRMLVVEQNWLKAAALTTLAAMFGSVGSVILTSIVVAKRRKHAAGYLKPKAPDDAPWLERPEWAAGRIPATADATMLVPRLAAVALWWNFATLPLLAAMPMFLYVAASNWAWFALLTPIPGLLFISAFLYEFQRGQKFGKPIFEMASIPGSLGGRLAGIVRIPRRMQPSEGFRLRLVCVEWLLHCRDERNTLVDHVVWQDERLVMDPIVEGNETEVPVQFVIPFELPETSRPKSQHVVQWSLETWARMPGIDFASKFEVPVYKTAESRPDFQLDNQLLAEYVPRHDNELVMRDAGISRESLGANGVRLTFKAARNWRTALIVSLFPLLAAGVVAFLLAVNGNEIRDFFNILGIWQRLAKDFNGINLLTAVTRTFITVVSGAMLALVLIYFFLMSIDLWFYRSVVEASPAGVRLCGGWLGLGRSHSFTADDIQRFKLEEYMRSSGAGLWQSVVLVPRRGRGEKRTIGKGIQSKLAQEAVIEELVTALGRTQKSE